jgi:hypothetical protein
VIVSGYTELKRFDVNVSVNQKIIAASAMLADRREPP